MPQSVKIKTHKINREYTGSYFFILSKGNNAGKPLVSPCPNCFVLVADDEAEKDILYWLCFGLWQGGFFRPLLRGSVIPFVVVKDLQCMITTASEKAAGKPDYLPQALRMLNTLTQHQDNLKEQLKLINEAKRALMYKLLK